MKYYIYVIAICFIFFGCNPEDIIETTLNPCDNAAQGVSITNFNENYLIDDLSITVHYVTGHPLGNYFHIFNNTSPTTTNFYTFAVNSGETST